MSDLLVTDAPQLAALEFNLCKEVAETLFQAYPGHLWAVNPEGNGSIIVVRNVSLTGQWGFVLHVPAIYSASEFKKNVIRAGGEILERYQMSRSQFKAAEYAALKTDFAGRILGDHS
ncbi:MAG TPA: hypothetical protein PLL30_17030 [Candidatus Krumholzibacteria bacterium]|nr:hypothetical protein [Candidatus Krumholzibacteria bacterium]HPD73479.1 hypothetical protein [Candidatus Krumholzibacteria bacterium]HRY42202.1 hypothetical protein [Candidatus Krumholzibacteria bacterium]